MRAKRVKSSCLRTWNDNSENINDFFKARAILYNNFFLIFLIIQSVRISLHVLRLISEPTEYPASPLDK